MTTVWAVGHRNWIAEHGGGYYEFAVEQLFSTREKAVAHITQKSPYYADNPLRIDDAVLIEYTVQ